MFERVIITSTIVLVTFLGGVAAGKSELDAGGFVAAGLWFVAIVFLLVKMQEEDR